MTELQQTSINALRLLAVDTVEKAKSGHPGAPLGDAPMAYLLFHDFMRHNPKQSKWSNRDRFVLSNGHASAMLYSLLHLSGYKVSIEDLQGFRQWGSKTPGHPEYHHTDGIEATTGPLGQGFAMGIGMALAEKHLAAVYNRPGYDIVDHYVYGICGDGDLMEGISHEAASLAGTLGLGKVIYLYDDNLISLDGPTSLSFTEDVHKRFEAYNWHVQVVEDGNDLEGIAKAIQAAKDETTKPSIIAVRTIIGFGSPKAGTNKVHGEPLGADGVKETKRTLGYPEDKSFYVPEDAAKHWGEVATKGAQYEQQWNELFARYKKEFPELAAEYERTQAGKLKADWKSGLPRFTNGKAIATRSAGNLVMNELAKFVPELIGGAADLTASTKTIIANSPSFHVDPKGVNVFFGVREFAMCAMVNGMAVHGGVIPYGSTFFVFSDYCKPALRLSALMQSHSIFVYTHDSVAVGEDGPTHEPIEHLMAFRVTPQLTDFRPADANETSAAWGLAIERNSPCFMALSRQDLPLLDPEKQKVFEGVAKGAYVVHEPAGKATLQIVATGAELWPSIKAAETLATEGVNVRVVSMPSWKIFDEQSDAYKQSIFPANLPTLAVEAGATMGWWKFVGHQGDVLGIDHFGASAPGPLVLEKFGFTPENIAKRVKALAAKA